MAAQCLNCGNWSHQWAVGQMCPECANGKDRNMGNVAKELVPVTMTVTCFVPGMRVRIKPGARMEDPETCGLEGTVVASCALGRPMYVCVDCSHSEYVRSITAIYRQGILLVHPESLEVI